MAHTRRLSDRQGLPLLALILIGVAPLISAAQPPTEKTTPPEVAPIVIDMAVPLEPERAPPPRAEPSALGVYRQYIESMEESAGAFAPGLTEQLLGLGLNLRATADDRVQYRFRNDPLIITGSEWVEDLATGEIEYKDVPVEDEVALMRAAMIVGLGIEYNLSGKTALLLGVTFNNGLFNVANSRNFGPTLDEEHLTALPVSDTAVPLFPEGYDRKMVDNAILLSLGLLF